MARTIYCSASLFSSTRFILGQVGINIKYRCDEVDKHHPGYAKDFKVDPGVEGPVVEYPDVQCRTADEKTGPGQVDFIPYRVGQGKVRMTSTF